MPLAATDRRTAIKERHRTAILTAATALLVEHSGSDFGVDELAARADVARRTVFNHFGSLDGVLLAVCTDALTVVIDDFLASVSSTAVGDGSRVSMLDELAVSLHDSDLPKAIATTVRVTGAPGMPREKAVDLARAAFSRFGDRLRVEVVRRNPAADDLDVDLLVGSLSSGLAVISRRWIELTGATLDDASRAEWDQLLARLLHSIRSGYMPT